MFINSLDNIPLGEPNFLLSCRSHGMYARSSAVATGNEVVLTP